MQLTFGQRGDTIIEVLLAITIFSMVSLGAITIMNQGTSAAQRSLEITLVRQQIDAQAEALRASQEAYLQTPNPVPVGAISPTWQDITGPSNTQKYPGFTAGVASCPRNTTDNIGGSFIMDARTAKRVTTTSWFKNTDVANDLPYARVDYSGTEPVAYSMWIEREVQTAVGKTPARYDFTVRACWYGAGLSTPMTMKTTVRLYDPVI